MIPTIALVAVIAYIVIFELLPEIIKKIKKGRS